MKTPVELAREYPITFEPVPEEDGSGFYAYSSAFPGILGDGSSRDEAADDLLTVLTDVIEKRMTANLPLPSVHCRSEYSGKLNLRISKSLHEMLAQRAQAESVSLNTLITQYISYGLGAKETSNQSGQVFHLHISSSPDEMRVFERYKKSSAVGWKRAETQDLYGGSNLGYDYVGRKLS